VPLPDDFEDVSREHALLAVAAGSLTVTDRSRNGTFVDGRRLAKDAPHALGERGTFRMGGSLTVHVVLVPGADAGAGAASTFNAVLRVPGSRDHPLPLGPAMVILVADGGGVAAESVGTDDPARVLQRYRDAGRPPYAAFRATAPTEAEVMHADGSTLAMMVNRARLAPGQRARLINLDVVRLGDLRVDIRVRRERAIECINPECRLLNPYDPTKNCRWCGFRLHEGVSQIIG
jgi:predicted component of type VI protein secretion system